MELTQEQINFIKGSVKHPDVCSIWRTKIRNNFPEVFGEDIEVGKWYRLRGTDFVYFLDKPFIPNERQTFYGFSHDGSWSNELKVTHGKETIELSKNEVLELLKAEAIKRGLTEGKRVCALKMDGTYIESHIFEIDEDKFSYDEDADEHSLDNRGRRVFIGGVWATKVKKKKMTKKQIEQELGFEIKIVKE